ncbi:ACT domain-containing protein [Geminicoccaceae bacterium 1502E]|nr:ACT domain-containing protein [Geminicoccaceae bacterium 1502E]
MPFLTLTLIGEDRPGLVELLSERIAGGGGNWLESRMARLGGRFAGVLLVEVPAEGVVGLGDALRKLEGQGLRVTVEEGGGEPAPAPLRTLELALVGHDRPGIVRDVARVLAARQVGIEELETGVESGSFSGEALFRARARLTLPAGLSPEELRMALETLANELMADLTLQEPPAA